MTGSAPTPKNSPKVRAAELRLKARAVARGVAVGRVVCLYGRKRQFCRIEIEAPRVEKEIRRFRAAARLAQRQLRKLTGGRDDSANRTSIFDAHLVMLEDRGLHEKIEAYIASENVNAEWAVKIVTDGYVALYKSIPDEHLREKYIDIEDVADRLLAALGGGGGPTLKLEKNSIIVAKEVKPSTLIELTASEPLAIITEHGGWTSHTFILAREMNLPAVTGMKGILRRVRTGAQVIVDGFNGQIILNPTLESVAEFSAAAAQLKAVEERETDATRDPLRTLDGVEITVRANFDLPQGFAKARKFGAKGIGLYRSEFLFNQYKGFPTEQEQVRAYRKIAKIAGDDGVRIRTFDLAADQLADESREKEANPALGLRAMRLVLSHKVQFRTQLRAILQASHGQKIDIVLPMVTDVAEITETKRLIAAEKERLRKRGIDSGEPRLGAMIEVPAAVFVVDEIAAEVDFLCLGTNDLVQYLLAVDRDNEMVADWFRTLHPAVLRAIKNVVDAADRKGIPAIVCGEMAGSPVYVAILIGLGVKELSMNVHSLPRVRRTVANIAAEEARDIVGQLRLLPTADDVEAFVGESFRAKWSHLFPNEILPMRRKVNASARRKSKNS